MLKPVFISNINFSLSLSIILLLSVFYTSTLIAECDKENFVVAIDIGHTQEKTGATSARGVGEFYFNKRIASRLLVKLLKKGFRHAFIINARGANIKLTDRPAIAESRETDLFISIHHDSVQPHYLLKWLYGGRELLYSDKFQGYSIFYSEEGQAPESSLFFAKLLGRSLLAHHFTPSLHHAEKIKGENRELIDPETGIYRFDQLVVLKKASTPAVLLECGVIVNRNEEIVLDNPVYQNALVSAISDAVEEFCADGFYPK